MNMSQTIQGIRGDVTEIVGTMARPENPPDLAQLGNVLDSVILARLLELVGTLTAELSRQLPEGRVEARLIGREEAELVYVPADPPPLASNAGDDDVARLTLRLPHWLKQELERQAESHHASINSWVVESLTDGVRRRARQTGKRLQGYGRS